MFFLIKLNENPGKSEVIAANAYYEQIAKIKKIWIELEPKFDYTIARDIEEREKGFVDLNES